MWSFCPNALLQFGHFLDREVRRSSTHSLQKTWPHVLMAVFLKLTRQTVQIASVWYEKSAFVGFGAADTTSWEVDFWTL